MRRRAFLAAGVSLLSGCGMVVRANDESAEDETPTPDRLPFQARIDGESDYFASASVEREMALLQDKFRPVVRLYREHPPLDAVVVMRDGSQVTYEEPGLGEYRVEFDDLSLNDLGLETRRYELLAVAGGNAGLIEWQAGDIRERTGMIAEPNGSGGS